MPQPVPAVPRRGRWLVLAGIVLVALNLRIAVAAVSPILDVVRRDVALDDTFAGVLGAAPLAAFALFGSLAPLVARRLGLESTLVVAMLLAGGGEVVRSLASTPSAFVGWSVVALGGMGMGNVLLPPLVKRYYPDRIGAVTAAYSVAMAVSTTVPPVVAVPLARELGWRTSLGLWSVIALLAVVPWVVVIVRTARAGAQLSGLRSRTRRGAGPGAPRRDPGARVWRSPLAWGMAATFGMNSLNTYVVFAWLPQILGDAGLGLAAGGRWLGFFAVLGLPLSVLGPMLAVRLRNPYPVVLIMISFFVVAYLGLMLSPATGTVVWMVLLGLAPGTFPVLLALINVRTRTSDGATSLSGFVQGVGYTIAVPGPVLVGMLYEATGGWTAVFGFLLATVAVLAVVSAVACRPVMLEDTWHGRAGRPDRASGTPAPLGTLDG